MEKTINGKEYSIEPGANLRGASLSGASLSGASLSLANLRGADLSDADLSGADLSDAYLRGADLIGANLRGANLSGAFLSCADIRGADIRGAFLPSPTMVLLAHWGEVGDNLTIELMRYDASCHPDPTAFDRWSASDDGLCPYNDVKVQRACYFRERRGLWSPGSSKRPYDLMVAVIRECCKDSDYHGGENG